MKNISWLVLLLLGTGYAAVAQTTANRPPSFGAAPRINAGAPTRQLGIRAAVDVSYDSNVFGISDARGDLTGGRSRDDIQVTPSLQLNLQLPFGRQSAFLRGQVGYDFYANNSQLNRERINLDGGVNLQLLSSCATSVTAAYARARSNAGDVFAVNPIPIISRTNTEQRTSFGGQVQCGGAIGLSPSFGYNHTETRNSSEFFAFNDSNQDAFDASLGYSRPTLGRVAVYGTYAEGEYLGRDVNGQRRTFFPFADVPNPFFNPNALDGVKSYSAGVRYERNIGSRASGSVSVGYSWVDPKSVASRPFRGNSYSGTLNLRPTDRLSVDLLASRAADLSNTVFATYAVTEIYSLNGTYRLNRKLAANFGSSYQTRDYRVTAPVLDGGIQFVTNDEFTRAYVGFIYDLNRRLRLNGLVSQQRRKSNNPLFNYNNTTVSLGASLSLGR